MRKFVSTFAVLLIFLTTINMQAQNQKNDSLRYKNNPLYGIETGKYDIYKTKQANIVMLGNSITHGAVWNELLGRPDVVERGIPSDILQGFAARMNYIYKLHPKIVFIMGGLNDIYNWTPVDEVFPIYIKIIEDLKARNIIPVIQSTTYATKYYGKEHGLTAESNFGRNREVDKLNKLLEDYAKLNNIDFIDLIPKIETADHYLRADLTIDGVHFNASAYKIWAEEVEKILAKHNL